ncbi:MAG TPA: OsmC family protein [Bacteroidia bacterium]|nr:OsmC family protein [Bacteroidia bacterium]HNS13604.1 OsmC family protein [Bacteroidia bacterium]
MKFSENIVVSNDGAEYLTRSVTGKHIIIGDEPADHGGTDAGPTAHQMLLSSLGMCMAITLRMYANRKKWDLKKVEIHLNMEKNPEDQGESTIIYKKVELFGELDEDQKKRLMIISEKCPVHKTLSGPIHLREFISV